MNLMNTGLKRKLDTLGRVTLPVDIRNTYKLAYEDEVEIYTNEDGIFLKKHNPGCILCGTVYDLVEFKGKKFCRACLKEGANL